MNLVFKLYFNIKVSYDHLKIGHCEFMHKEVKWIIQNV